MESVDNPNPNQLLPASQSRASVALLNEIDAQLQARTIKKFVYYIWVLYLLLLMIINYV